MFIEVQTCDWNYEEDFGKVFIYVPSIVSIEPRAWDGVGHCLIKTKGEYYYSFTSCEVVLSQAKQALKSGEN